MQVNRQLFQFGLRLGATLLQNALRFGGLFQSTEAFRVASRVAHFTLRNLFSEIQPNEIIARMRLTELQDFLERCTETSRTVQEQVSKYADVGTDELAHLAREQIQRGELDRQLADLILQHAHLRLGDIEATVTRFDNLASANGMNDAATETSALLNHGQDMEVARNGVIVITFTSRVASLFLRLPSVSGVGASLLPVSLSNVQLFLSSLSVTGTVLSILAMENVESLVKRLQQLTDEYHNLHKDLSQVRTTVHRLLENTRATEGDLVVAQDDLARYSVSDYQAVGLRVSIDRFLHGLEKLKAQCKRPQPTAFSTLYDNVAGFLKRQTTAPWNSLICFFLVVVFGIVLAISLNARALSSLV